MTSIDVQALRTVSLFARFNDDELHTLAQQLTVTSRPASSLLFREGDRGGTMYILQSGRVELTVRDKMEQPVTLRFVEPGEVFGEMSLLDNAPRSASALAVTDIDVLVINREALLVVFERHPGVSLRMLEIMSQRLRETTALVQDRILPNVNEEIAVHVTLGDRISDFFTNFSGNIYFVAFSLVWFVVWIVWNLDVIPGVEPFDPFPFGFLTMVVSLEMVFLSLFILIKQARQAANDKVRNDIEYEINVRAELGVRALSKQLELLEYRMIERMERLEEQADWTGDKKQHVA
jgi:uncharacterized membrane protein